MCKFSSSVLHVWFVYVLLWTPTHGRAKAGRPARIYIQQLGKDKGCNLEDLPEVMNDREEWRERVRDIRADDMCKLLNFDSKLMSCWFVCLFLFCIFNH